MLAFIAGLIVGGLAVYLVLRNNPNLKSKVDTAADAIEKKIDERKG